MNDSTRTNGHPDAGAAGAARGCRRTWRAVLALVTLCLVGDASPRGASAAPASKEYPVKAAYLLNFAQFIEWPKAAFADADAPVTIGVLGDDPFGAVLDQTVAGETVQGRKLVVKRSRKVDDLKSCHILFVSAAEKPRHAQILADLGNAGVATVSEVDGFAARGGVINFYLEGNKVRFEINPASAERRGLKISSKLLKLARIVVEEG